MINKCDEKLKYRDDVSNPQDARFSWKHSLLSGNSMQHRMFNEKEKRERRKCFVVAQHIAGKHSRLFSEQTLYPCDLKFLVEISPRWKINHSTLLLVLTWRISSSFIFSIKPRNVEQKSKPNWIWKYSRYTERIWIKNDFQSTLNINLNFSLPINKKLKVSTAKMSEAVKRKFLLYSETDFLTKSFSFAVWFFTLGYIVRYEKWMSEEEVKPWIAYMYFNERTFIHIRNVKNSLLVLIFLRHLRIYYRCKNFELNI